MGLFDSAAENHPIYERGVLIQSSGTALPPTPPSVADVISQASFRDEFVVIEHVRALLDAGAGAHVTGDDEQTPLQIAAKRGWCHLINLLLNHGTDPLAEQDGHLAGWPLFLAHHAGHKHAVLALLPATAAAYAASLKPPLKVGEIHWLASTWVADFGDPTGDAAVLVKVLDGWSHEIGGALYALPAGPYRVYIERVFAKVIGFGGPPRVIGFAREKRRSKVAVPDHEAVQRSLERGYLGAASSALDLNFEDVKHEVEGRYRRMFK